ncbi:MAG: PLP-dependent aminotransferase family protein [Planctomycetales bacterium]
MTQLSEFFYASRGVNEPATKGRTADWLDPRISGWELPAHPGWIQTARKKQTMLDESRLSQRAKWAVGQPISYLMQEALARPELISLAAGFVDQATLPVEPARQAIDYLLSDPVRSRAALQYCSTMGDPDLRGTLLTRLHAADNTLPRNHSIDQVIVTAGSNELLYLTSISLLDPGDIVLCAAPSYFVYLGGLANLGARSFGVTVDNEGIVPEALQEALNKCEAQGLQDRVKAIYVTTYFDNPSSITTSRARRAEIVEIARRWSRDHHKIYVIEDTAYRELRYFGEDIPSLLACDEDGDTVIYTSSFSNSFSPGLRVGWGVLPKELVEPICNQKGDIDFGSPNFSQQIIAAVFELGLYEQHVEMLCKDYRKKLEAMLAAAEEHFKDLPNVTWLPATGGLYVWLRVAGVDTGSQGPLFQRAMDEGMLYVPGNYCYPQEGEPAADDMIRLSFGVQPVDRIHRGVQALAEAVRSLAHDTTPSRT